MFVDLEGDPFVGEQGLQYLFGFAVKNVGGEFVYEKRWALSCEKEEGEHEVSPEVAAARAEQQNEPLAAEDLGDEAAADEPDDAEEETDADGDTEPSGPEEEN